MNMRITGLLLGAALLAACATTAPPAASEQERTEAMIAYMACLHVNARKLDDHRSDAATIAIGLRSVCADSFLKSLETYSRQMNPVARRMFMNKAEDSFIRQATTAVLDERASR